MQNKYVKKYIKQLFEINAKSEDCRRTQTTIPNDVELIGNRMHCQILTRL